MSDKKYLVSQNEVREIVKDAYRRGSECRPMIDQKWFEEHECKDGSLTSNKEQNTKHKKIKHDCDDYGNYWFSCTRCGSWFVETMNEAPFSYCPYCGAKVVW